VIKDILIIKDGLPLLSRNFSSSESIFNKIDNLIMMSGFFSALNSFSDQFENLGTISELKLANKDLRMSFLRDKKLPNLIYLATFDENSKDVNVRRALRKISHTFLKKYNVKQILNWRGKKDVFKEFEKVIEQYIEDEKEENDEQFKEKIITLFKNVQEKFNLPRNERDHNLERIIVPVYYNYIPILRSSEKINPNYYLTGVTSITIFKEIDGKKTITQIAKKLNLSEEKVFNICKNLIKLGFINLFQTNN